MITNNTRKFGVEIEFCSSMGDDELASKLRDAGVNVQAEGYNHETRGYWKIVDDGSVSRGWELVSPPLSGQAGLDEVRKAANALVELGATIDLTCGLHVHVDANDLSSASIVNAVKRYARHDAEINKLVPSFRRNNEYAGGVDRVASVLAAHLSSNPSTTTRQLCQRVAGRYYKLNTASFLRYGTLEFRQHSGSIDGTKIANWIVFCVQFVEDSIVAPVVAPVVSTVQVTASTERTNAIGKKFAKLLELLWRTGNYCVISAATIATSMEISEASVPSYISMFRDRYPTVTIKSKRGQGYYTTLSPMIIRALVTTPSAPVAPSVAPTVAVDQGVYANLPALVRAFYQERALEFGSQISA